MPIVPKTKPDHQQWITLATCFAVFLTSNWFRVVLNFHPELTFFLLGLNLFFSWILTRSSVRKRTVLASIALFSLLCLFLIIKFPDSTLWQQTPEETQLINQRRSFYPTQIGKIYQNKASLITFKLERNLFNSLDTNLYFFAGHPRERLGIAEFEKFSFVLLPFFVLGLIKIINTKPSQLLVLVFVAAISSSLLDPAAKSGPLPFFPVISSIISIGFARVFKVDQL